MIIQLIKAKKNVILVAFSVFLIISIIYVCNARYSISEISPDNYRTKLKENDASLFEAGLDQVIPENFSISISNEYATSDNFRNNGVKITNKKTDDGNWVEINSKSTKLSYWIAFNEGRMTDICIFKSGIIDPNLSYNPLVKEMINKLVLLNEFSLKRTRLKDGVDIIIKETDDCFIIGSFFSYDDQVPNSSIVISTFSKKKYF